jgi:hypothetical protein
MLICVKVLLTMLCLSVNPLSNLDIACEGGWGINTFYAMNPTAYVAGYGFMSNAVAELMRDDVIAHPLFTPFRAEANNMHSTNLFTVADEAYRKNLRAKFLGDAIPARSFAAGRNATAGLDENLNMQSIVQSNPWPGGRIKNSVRQWYHSDIKNLAYFYVHQIFSEIKTWSNH